MKQAIRLSLAILALAATTVAKYSVQDRTSQTADHDQNSQAKKSNPQSQPTATLKAKQDVPLQTPTTKERKESIHSDSTEPDWWTRISNLLIALGTLALAGVGAVGTCAAIKTLKAIQRQGRIMIRQSRVLQRQAATMEQQAATMEQQTRVAESTAKTAESNLRVFVSKERARLRIEPSPLSLQSNPLHIYSADFTIRIYGTTAAFITDAKCVADTVPENLIGVDEEPILFELKIPKVIAPDAEPTKREAIIWAMIEDKEITEIKKDRLFVELRGFINYTDVFDQGHETRFRYVWKFLRIPGLISDESDMSGDWEKCGPEGDNIET